MKRISWVQGIKIASSAAIVAELGEAARLPGEKKINSFAGQVLSVRKSGKRSWYGVITKHGSRYLRCVLVQCALAAIKVRDSRLGSSILH